MNWILARLKERNSWIGITSFITAVGISISPELVEAIAAAGVAISGLLLVVFKDDKTAIEEKIDGVTVE